MALDKNLLFCRQDFSALKIICVFCRRMTSFRFVGAHLIGLIRYFSFLLLSHSLLLLFRLLAHQSKLPLRFQPTTAYSKRMWAIAPHLLYFVLEHTSTTVTKIIDNKEFVRLIFWLRHERIGPVSNELAMNGIEKVYPLDVSIWFDSLAWKRWFDNELFMWDRQFFILFITARWFTAVDVLWSDHGKVSVGVVLLLTIRRWAFVLIRQLLYSILINAFEITHQEHWSLVPLQYFTVPIQSTKRLDLWDTVQATNGYTLTSAPTRIPGINHLSVAELDHIFVGWVKRFNYTGVSLLDRSRRFFFALFQSA